MISRLWLSTGLSISFFAVLSCSDSRLRSGATKRDSVSPAGEVIPGSAAADAAGKRGENDGGFPMPNSPSATGGLDADRSIARNLNILCSDEAAGRSINGVFEVQSEYQVNFEAVCSRPLRGVQSESTPNAIDVVFVLDVTASMEHAIDAVKQGVVGLSLELEKTGSDARFAAVGFRDSIWSTVNFTTAHGLSDQIRGWQAAEGQDAQEAGQLALVEAARMLREARGGSQKAILLATNSSFYSGTNHRDFSVTSVTEAFASLKGLAFYTAVPKDCEDYKKTAHDFSVKYIEQHGNSCSAAFGGPPPIEMAQQIRSGSPVLGKDLPYPLSSATVSGEFSKNLQSEVTNGSEKCFLIDATMLTPGSGVYHAGLEAAKARVAPVTISMTPTGDIGEKRSVMAQIKRCCLVGLSNVCANQESSVTIQF